MNVNSPGDRWYGNYLTEVIEKQLDPYISEREFLFPLEWFFRIDPPDQVYDPEFRETVYQKIPVQRVLIGDISLSGNTFDATVQLVQYPGKKVLKSAEDQFNTYNIRQFVQWIISNFGEKFPLKNGIGNINIAAADSLLEALKIQYYQREYKKCLTIINAAENQKNLSPKFDVWEQYVRIKIAGLDSQQNPIDNPFSNEIPNWKKNLALSRNRLLDYLRLEKFEKHLDIMIAESYLWEKDYGSAEIFLKKVYVDNPFNIDMLINLSFLHPSRYKEFGFDGARDIYERILDLCPIEENTLLRWSDMILLGNPSFTAPPKFALREVENYLSMNPRSYRAWLMHGKIFAHALDRDKALVSFDKADSLNPGNGLIQYNIGIIYYETGRLDQAEVYFKRAIEYQNYLDAYLYLGAIYKDQGKFEEALEKFRYRVIHKSGEDDYYALQAMKGIQECLAALGGNSQIEENNEN
jgi:tetratricopeptide (TPR) repeat protein